MPRGGGRDDRRSRYGGGPRDDYDRNDRRRDRDRGGDNRDNRDDRRRYRSRSRDRRDRDPRPRSRDRQRDDHEHERDRDAAAAGRDRDRDRRDRDGRRGGHGPDDGRRKRDDGDLDRPSRRRDDDAPPRDRRRSASPRQGTTSPPPRARRPDSRHAETLPTRSKGAGASASDKPKKDQHPMSFKMGGSGRNGSPAVAGDEDRGRQDSRTPMEEERRKEAGDDEEEDEDLEVEVEDGGMAAMMGFGGFGTTKGKKIAGNNAGGVHKEKTSEYRQYMNRQGGFNRPLSPSR